MEITITHLWRVLAAIGIFAVLVIVVAVMVVVVMARRDSRPD